MSIIEQLEKAQVETLAADRPIPEFRPGDTVRVNVKVVEGSRQRIQAFEGVCIARTSRGLNTSFTVRKLSYGEGVERVFPLYSPSIAGIDVVRRGDVRRAKLYYLRGRTGKRARIAEQTDGYAAKLSAMDRQEREDAKAAAAAQASAPSEASAADAPAKTKGKGKKKAAKKD